VSELFNRENRGGGCCLYLSINQKYKEGEGAGVGGFE